MDLVALGLAIRALRRRRRWRQVDVGRAGGVSQALVSAIERGHGDRLSLRRLTAVAAALDARLAVQIRWRGGDLERLVDSDHAALAATMSSLLEHAGWIVRIEVTYVAYRAGGSIDILAWHAATRTLLVIEIKTEITSAEATLRKLDEKVRVAAAVARERFAWDPLVVARLLVIEDASTARRRVEAHSALFDAALPARGRDVSRWLKQPHGSVAGRYFLSSSTRRSDIQPAGGRHRVRRRAGPSSRAHSNVGKVALRPDDPVEGRIPTILVG